MVKGKTIIHYPPWVKCNTPPSFFSHRRVICNSQRALAAAAPPSQRPLGVPPPPLACPRTAPPPLATPRPTLSPAFRPMRAPTPRLSIAIYSPFSSPAECRRQQSAHHTDGLLSSVQPSRSVSGHLLQSLEGCHSCQHGHSASVVTA
jgi:hypothetical protein